MKKLFILLLISATIISCNNNKTVENEKTAVTLEQISNLEDQLFSSEASAPDVAKATKLATMYVDYANQNPNDSLAADYLFKASDISMNMNNPQNTVALFKHIMSKYPDYKNIPTIMFLTGFVYDDQLQDYESAKKYYNEFLAKYPESDFADDARISLQNLGKTPEELIKEFENINN